MVVAGADPVEQRRGDLHAERLAGVLLDPDGQRQVGALELELDFRLVCDQLVLDDVSRDLAVHGADLVPGRDSGALSRGGGDDGHHTGQWHGYKATGRQGLHQP